MASFGNHLSLFFLLVLLLLVSPQIQANFFSHLRTKEPQLVIKELAKTPAPAPASVPTTTIAATPAFAPEFPIVGPGPAPEAFFLDMGDGYGLYGIHTDPNEYSPTKETPATNTNFENELLNEDLNGESFKTWYPKHPPIPYRKQYNREEYRSNYKYSNQLNNYYDGKREGMSDTRFVENGKYYHDVKNENENYSNVNVKGYESTDKNKYPNEYNTMEEYEKEQQSQGYIP
ncbi:hypothetical protein L6164_022382 [Bauhinia variegata]|uniref:Uncharacterized protein n=1 Tax=Bauhinia variegata TaxID=167791 RepID=A0ACB9MIC9_BAUVA|nr:hypothetical protein L6164_022382 [Bauhinia variegata]